MTAKVSWDFEEKMKEVEEPRIEVIPLQNEIEMQQAMQQFPEQAEEMQAMMQAGQKPFVKVQNGTKMVQKMVTVKNQPYVELCRSSQLYIDPTAEGSISNAQFVIHEFKSSLSKLKADGRYKNLDKINVPKANTADEDPLYDEDEKREFEFSDEARREITIAEYWGNYDMNGDGVAEPIVCVWAGDVIIRLEDNPYPDGETPFVSCALDSEPFSIDGEANAELIGTDQRIKTGIKRAVLDTIDSSTAGQKGSKKGSLDPMNLKKFRRKEFFEYNEDQPNIWEGKFQTIPNDIMSFYGIISEEVESLTGVRPGYGNQAASMSATASRGALDATAKRATDVSRNYKENFLMPILRKWFSMAQVLMSDEEIIRITNDEEVAIRRDDMGGEIDIQINVSTPEEDAAKAQELSFLLQTTAQSLPFDITKLLLSKHLKLGNMPDAAKQLEEYQPQPDPIAQEKAMLEIEKLKAEIAERNSRAAENQVDIRLKTANAQLAEARAREIHSSADQKDQDFLDNASGKKHSQDMEKQDQKIQGDIIKQGMSNRGNK